MFEQVVDKVKLPGCVSSLVLDAMKKEIKI